MTFVEIKERGSIEKCCIRGCCEEREKRSMTHGLFCSEAFLGGLRGFLREFLVAEGYAKAGAGDNAQAISQYLVKEGYVKASFSRRPICAQLDSDMAEEKQTEAVMHEGNMPLCPFCRDINVTIECETLSQELEMWAECQNCLARGPVRSSKIDAIEAWSNYCKFLCERGGEQVVESSGWPVSMSKMPICTQAYEKGRKTEPVNFPDFRVECCVCHEKFNHDGVGYLDGLGRACWHCLKQACSPESESVPETYLDQQIKTYAGNPEFIAEEIGVQVVEDLLAEVERQRCSRKWLCEQLGISSSTLDDVLQHPELITILMITKLATVLGLKVEVALKRSEVSKRTTETTMSPIHDEEAIAAARDAINAETAMGSLAELGYHRHVGESEAQVAPVIRCHVCQREMQASENFPFIDDKRCCWPCAHSFSKELADEWDAQMESIEKIEVVPLTYPEPTEPGWRYAKYPGLPKEPVLVVRFMGGLKVLQVGVKAMKNVSDFTAWGQSIPEWKE